MPKKSQIFLFHSHYYSFFCRLRKPAPVYNTVLGTVRLSKACAVAFFITIILGNPVQHAFAVSTTFTEPDQINILALGDSLTAGYGLPTGEGFVPTLENWLQKEFENQKADLVVTVTNAGVSGDTTSGGLSRLSWSLGAVTGKPDLVIVELGANDGLRGITPRLTRDNLDKIVAQLKEQDITVLLTGMLAPPNLGSGYATEFNALFADIAEKHDVSFYPFFLEGVAADPSLNQADGIHPTAEGVDIIVNKIGPYVLKALDKAAAIRSY